ncbi:uncharacterized protein LOC27207766 [Drosophila simulans]|uniref:Uncharacterized protein n=2 Tax=melanogaster subgroup TaxID=32351 RepID=A0A0J9RH29_DROSI|nr:uncharacterized protein LOC27207766 [Drosophila simulans]XP_033153952.1 uncharacterized protein LOC117136925 [Drosophila mauritiana]XP_033172628.1 uncharacterized protein LOC117149089 [Drosophila mauritiana]KMY94804.1 uncharacterized protein Dsimw501_GD27917 [Drosophila simulans]
MKCFSILFALLALISFVEFGYARTIPRITIRNGDIIVHGNCHGCTARATKNSAHLSIKFTRRW